MFGLNRKGKMPEWMKENLRKAEEADAERQRVKNEWHARVYAKLNELSALLGLPERFQWGMSPDEYTFGIGEIVAVTGLRLLAPAKGDPPVAQGNHAAQKALDAQ